MPEYRKSVCRRSDDKTCHASGGSGGEKCVDKLEIDSFFGREGEHEQKRTDKYDYSKTKQEYSCRGEMSENRVFVRPSQQRLTQTEWFSHILPFRDLRMPLRQISILLYIKNKFFARILQIMNARMTKQCFNMLFIDTYAQNFDFESIFILAYLLCDTNSNYIRDGLRKK